MKQVLLMVCWATLLAHPLVAQVTRLQGRVVEMYSRNGVADVQVELVGSTLITYTNEAGFFEFSGDSFPWGEQVLRIEKQGYSSKNYPIIISAGDLLTLGEIFIETDWVSEVSVGSVISLSEEELDEEQGSVATISGLLYASRDVLHQAAAYDFSALFFRPRGLDSEYGKVYINGLEMNKLLTGRPQWSNWGGLNDVQRNQVVSSGQSPTEVGFGGIAGNSNIQMRASEYRAGGRVSYAFSNKTYTGRVMGTYHTGNLPSGWAFSLAASRRFATSGIIEGTPYDANGFFAALEKKITDRHSLHLLGIYTPNRRGRSAPLTQEAFDIKGATYNPYWGSQDGKIRNSRLREIDEPLVILSYYGQLSEKSQLNVNLGYQFGKTTNSRLGYDKVPSPDPVYYRYMPSYFLTENSGPDYESAYRRLVQLQQNGQIDWNHLYETNWAYGGTSRYYLYDDRNDDRLLHANMLLNTTWAKKVQFQAGVNYKKLTSDNYAQMKDLLGGKGYLDINTFSTGEQAQPDLQNPNRIVTDGQKFKYHYQFLATTYDAFAQAVFRYRTVDFYVAATASHTSYQRNGFYQNGSFPDHSLGKSPQASFTNFGFKGGGTYKISGRHLVELNGATLSKPPALRYAFSNARQNNQLVRELDSEKIRNLDLSYMYRSSRFSVRLSGAYTASQDATQIAFYYADGISGISQTNDNFFIQEVMTGVDKRYYTAELGWDWQILSSLKLKGVASVGDYFYSDHARLYLTSDDFKEPVEMGKTYIKNYHLPGGPQRAYQLGVEYRDPDFWWVGVTANLMTHAYLNISPLLRTQNFYKDTDGQPFNEYDATLARELLKQEVLDDVFLVNVIGGKSWKVRSYSIGFFASINNVLNVTYKTGGYEQGRNANYRNLLEDKSRTYPVFASKYWFGGGTTYFINFYIRY